MRRKALASQVCFKRHLPFTILFSLLLLDVTVCVADDHDHHHHDHEEDDDEDEEDVDYAWHFVCNVLYKWMNKISHLVEWE